MKKISTVLQQSSYKLIKNKFMKNVGKIDRIIRVVLSLVILWQALMSFNVILLVVGIMLLLTGLVGKCGLYKLLKINTCKNC